MFRRIIFLPSSGPKMEPVHFSEMLISAYKFMLHKSSANQHARFLCSKYLKFHNSCNLNVLLSTLMKICNQIIQCKLTQ